MTRSKLEQTEKLGLIACSCGRCCNVDRFEALEKELNDLKKELNDININKGWVSVNEIKKDERTGSNSYRYKGMSYD